MTKFSKIALLALTTLTLGLSAQGASAQSMPPQPVQIGFDPNYGPVCNYRGMNMTCADAANQYGWDYAAFSAQSGVTGGLMAYGVPAPIAAAGGDLAGRNVSGARNEPTVAGQVLYAGTGISIDAIQQNGWKGGENSVASQVCNFLGC